ncbi:hypothetical protein SAMN05421835_108185 [Amycolatopsis sacchari]|uniref:Uncharacterized protein n=1 Tax=Amycolatopsis sacchari TaxID=115433 RepID=A0A1I3U294_9PSEU|nr:hypothetical protein [Amycolatopsis sacchari]SFJ76649.1 hypothetical protein SAMN05421835_108185 [Amycolatopsis sacchari]
MSVFEVLERRGTWVLLKFTGAVALFLLLHLVRIPLVLIARVLEIVLHRVNGFATRVSTQAPAGPVNQFFHSTQARRGEATNVHA